jgi:prolyl 4-hydroxylase
MKLGIEIYDNVLTSDQCQELISLYESDKRKTPGVVGNYQIVDSVKKSTDVCCNFTDIADNNYNKILLPALHSAVDKFVSQYQILKMLSLWRVDDVYNIQKYENGEGYFRLHCEHEISNPDRILAWMIYLNDAQCGTEFPYQNLITESRAGRCVVWSAGWTHAHKGVTPNIGVKYIATGWYQFIRN